MSELSLLTKPVSLDQAGESAYEPCVFENLDPDTTSAACAPQALFEGDGRWHVNSAHWPLLVHISAIVRVLVNTHAFA